MTEPTVQRIVIQTKSAGPVTVNAEIIGHFAVHPMFVCEGPIFSRSYYTVTHIPSGWAVQTRLSLPDAQAMARDLMAIEKAPWKRLTVQRLTAIKTAAFCLSKPYPKWLQEAQRIVLAFEEKRAMALVTLWEGTIP